MDSADGLIEAAEATGNPHMLAWALAAYGSAFRDADPVAALNALRRGLVIAQDSGNRAHASALATGGPSSKPNTATPCPLRSPQSGDPIANATARRIVTTPAAIWISRWRRPKARTRSATRRPARAKNSSSTAAPTANAMINTIVGSPTEPVAPPRTMAASTGPAHGTYSTPSAPGPVRNRHCPNRTALAATRKTASPAELRTVGRSTPRQSRTKRPEPTTGWRLAADAAATATPTRPG
jgi:hypothetical protein